VISVPLASCRQPDGGEGEPGSGDPCNQYPSETECYRYGSNMSCYWNGNVCVTE
jgi:hypothetical protein